jgi:hypothetical protein
MPSTVAALVTDPNSFFRDRRDAPSFAGPVLIITLIAILGVISSVISIRGTAGVMSQMISDADAGQSVQTLFQAFQLVGVVIGFVATYVIWVVWTGIFYGVSAVFDGSGSFTTTLKLVGWGFVPSVAGSLVSLFITVYRFEVRGFDVPTDAGPQAAQQFSQQISSGPLVALSAVLGLVFTLWAGLLWTFAVKHARQVTTRNAAIAVAVPVLFGLVGSLWGVVTALGLL